MIGLMVAAAAAGAAAPSSRAPHIGQIRMHLFLEESGRLSPDIAPPHEFIGWNTIIGEGSAGEAANDLLILVEAKGTGGKENIALPLSIVARGRGGKVIGQRRFKDSLLTSADGRVWKSLWLQDVGCAGIIRVTATLGRSIKSTSIALDCGE